MAAHFEKHNYFEWDNSGSSYTLIVKPQGGTHLVALQNSSSIWGRRQIPYHLNHYGIARR